MKPDSPVMDDYARAANMLEALFRLRHVWAGFQPAMPMNRGDIMALGALDELTRRGGPVTVSRLAERMHQSLPGASQRVSALEQMDYLRRLPDPSDRRVSCVEITEKGKKAADESLRVFLGQIEQALDVLGAEKADALLALVDQMISALQQVRRQAGDG